MYIEFFMTTRLSNYEWMIGIERWGGGVWQTQELLLAKGRPERDDWSVVYGGNV